MNIYYESSFYKDLKWIKNRKLLVRVKQIIQEIKQEKKMDNIKSIKKMKGYNPLYRIRKLSNGY